MLGTCCDTPGSDVVVSRPGEMEGEIRGLGEAGQRLQVAVYAQAVTMPGTDVKRMTHVPSIRPFASCAMASADMQGGAARVSSRASSRSCSMAGSCGTPPGYRHLTLVLCDARP